MKNKQLVVLADDRVITEDGNIVLFYIREELEECPDTVIKKLVEIINTTSQEFPLGSGSAIDEYLLNEPDCTEDEREYITEELYHYYCRLNNSYPKI